MKINLDEKPFAHIYTSIGELFLFSISYNDIVSLIKKIGKPFNAWEPTEFFRHFVGYICFPASALKEGEVKPDIPVLTNDEIKTLNDNDLESIAKAYFEGNMDSYREIIFKNETDNEGKAVLTSEYGNIELPQHENESFVHYMLRLFIKDEERRKEQTKSLLDSVSNYHNFAKNVGDSINSTLTLGSSLRKSIDGIRRVRNGSENIYISRTPPIDFGEIARKEEERRIKPFNQLSIRLDKLIEISAQTIDYIIKANETQTLVANELKESSNDAKKYAKITIILTIIIIILTAIGIYLTTN